MTKPNDLQDGQRHEFEEQPAWSSIKALCAKMGCGQPREAEIHARYVLSGRCDNGSHSVCPYPDKCRCDCHEPAPQQPEPPERIWLQRSPDGSWDNRFIWTAGEACYIREDIALASAEGEIRRQALEEAAEICLANARAETAKGAKCNPQSRDSFLVAHAHIHNRALASSAPQADPAESVAEPAMTCQNCLTEREFLLHGWCVDCIYRAIQLYRGRKL